VQKSEASATIGKQMIDTDAKAAMPESLSPEDAKVLLGLCRAGKLYGIERWIASGKPIRMPSKGIKTPLQIAIDLGFHSLIELLIRNEDSQEAKSRALLQAVERKRLDLIEMLVSYGADVRSVPLADVLLSWEPRIIRLFLDSGADAVTGAPFRRCLRREGANSASSLP
jgi:hypothetical protein